MKAVILAGGLGTRISEETHLRPKPMIEIGGKPILWHIMKSYSAHGVNDFVICCGYKGYIIKEYFANYFLHMSDVTFDMVHNRMEVHEQKAEPWRVTLVDTGEDTMTGGRLRRVKEYLKDEEAFCFTYGDGVADVDVGEAIAIGEAERFIGIEEIAHAAQAASGLRILAGIDQRHTPGFGVLLVHFHPVVLHVEGHVRHVQEVVGEILLDHIALVAQADDEIVDAVGGVDFHDVPDDRLAADFDHGLGLQVGFLADAGA